ncbi:MAG TPA: flagellar hook-associated protein FlgL [Steroidobacteraceae bacterium]|nr:flagellar hook-associated protein FlgL [Steroidobacteraceae bacterium]
MTISTLTFRTNALAQMEALETAMSQTQSQLSTGKKLQRASDNPAAMAQVNALNAQLSASQQQVSNGNAVTSLLQLEQNALNNATTALQSARDLAVEANNSDLNTTERQGIVAQLQQLQQSLLGAANSRDAGGNYLFGGTASTAPPFVQGGGAVTYVGNDQVNQVQISPDQSVSVGDAGSSVFMNLPTGNGTFTTAAAAGNTGSASIDPGSVTNQAAWVPDTYSIAFTSPTQYQVTNAAGAVVTSGNYVSGDAITFNGAQVTVSGTPAAGDQFTVAPAGTGSVFSAINSLITTLSSTTLTSSQVATQLGGALQQIDTGLNNLGNVQAGVGGRLNAVTAAATSAQTTQTNIQTSVSQLSDVDYAAAVTQLSGQELALQAAQESYASMAKLSLFNYLS